MGIDSKYINPYTDFGFKKLFGTELNKDLLIGFLNALFEEAKQIPGDRILDIKYLNNEQLGRTPHDRKAVFDVLCETEKGAKFHVEMQNVFQEFFIDRTIFYAARSIQNMAKRYSSTESRWNFQLQKLYSVNLLNFTFKEKEKQDKNGNTTKNIVNEISDEDLTHCVMLKNVKTHKIFYDKLVFIYLEMPKFQKPIEECKSFYEKWLFVLQNLTRLMERPKELQEKVFQKLFEQAEIAKYTPEEYSAYEDSLISLWDIANSNEAAEKKGIEKGEKSKAIATARTMKADNMPMEMIIKYTGLTIDEIDEL
ncbi:MAG: Rpn family recombination-promoting nuclease/putative transposase [Bacteroidales bacterium]|nr:Rpn family recombination-promoting nuclease/putative transposase [Bacteroidales bacterium]